MLSFASIHKTGVQAQMMNLKIEALHDLSKSSGLDLCPVAAVQHLAAGMLLCAIEVSHRLNDATSTSHLDIWKLMIEQIHRSSCTTGQWLIYLSGAKNVVRSGKLLAAEPGTDLAILLDWLYYFDVLARFSFQHWHGSYTDEANPKAAVFDPGALRAEVSLMLPAKYARVPSADKSLFLATYERSAVNGPD
jgi:hypothetical protein